MSVATAPVSTPPSIYVSKHKIRLVTATSLFDGHDASINIMRRILQSSGAEIIHLGHNRSVREIVDAAIQEDVQGIAISSYQGGHMEYFSYMIDLLNERGCSHIKVFGGGGGVIVPVEIEALHQKGVCRIFSPEDGRKMGLQGMINWMLEQCDFDTLQAGRVHVKTLTQRNPVQLARAITALENNRSEILSFSDGLLHDQTGGFSVPAQNGQKIPLLGITGTGGAGKSSVTDELVRRFLHEFPELNVAILSIDPSKRKTGGALLGDRIRMNSIDTPRVYMRSLATRADNRATSEAINGAVAVCKAAHFDVIFVETSGIGQSDTEIVDIADISLYVMTSEYGAATQLEKINMLDLADFVVLNKFEKRGALDALRDIRKQVRRNRNAWEQPDSALPVYPTMASQFNDEGINRLFGALVQKINKTYGLNWAPATYFAAEPVAESQTTAIIPAKKTRYLSEISDTIRHYHQWAKEQAGAADNVYKLDGALALAGAHLSEEARKSLEQSREKWTHTLDPESVSILKNWDNLTEQYRQDYLEVKVRDKVSRTKLFSTSLSGNRIPRVALPPFQSAYERLRWALKENLPGYFPFTAGVFPFKRDNEDPTRMFAGEGTPERTNRRFHFVSSEMPAKRLSTAFDSVTLYGEDPDLRPDIYGKIGNSGVSICTVDCMKKLYSGFDLTNPATSVSMTINGPAPIILAMFMNAVIDQEVERFLKQEGRLEEAVAAARKKLGKAPFFNGKLPQNNDGFGLATLGISGDKLVDSATYAALKAKALQSARGTVQADILKEDQAQNTCIFSTEFALRMMGDIQQYFTTNQVRNFYSVSISGYHIAEAGANPVSQAAFTLANGFTFVEYYLARGLHIDDFAHNLSFFFSNGLDPEYAVIGRVARRIWAVAMKKRYGANERSQKLKYHIQTSGRSLHAQEIQFNDIRTTLQALLAIYDNCNSLHTNAYDEAITTPTEESVRRALAIQLIINKELGLAKNENPLQGSFIIEELTDLVEEAILAEFDRLTDRGGVLGAMESMYQRGKIQDESLYYETLKHNGELPIIGVNTFLDPKRQDVDAPPELIRSTVEEKQQQLDHLHWFHTAHAAEAGQMLKNLQNVARSGGNIFEALMETVKVCSLGQISHALYEVGGQYRRNM
jgi:methylmalonyl-CoA mutase